MLINEGLQLAVEFRLGEKRARHDVSAVSFIDAFRTPVASSTTASENLRKKKYDAKLRVNYSSS
jgi:hypothetical protein